MSEKVSREVAQAKLVAVFTDIYALDLTFGPINRPEDCTEDQCIQVSQAIKQLPDDVGKFRLGCLVLDETHRRRYASSMVERSSLLDYLQTIFVRHMDNQLFVNDIPWRSVCAQVLAVKVDAHTFYDWVDGLETLDVAGTQLEFLVVTFAPISIFDITGLKESAHRLF